MRVQVSAFFVSIANTARLAHSAVADIFRNQIPVVGALPRRLLAVGGIRPHHPDGVNTRKSRMSAAGGLRWQPAARMMSYAVRTVQSRNADFTAPRSVTERVFRVAHS